MEENNVPNDTLEAFELPKKEEIVRHYEILALVPGSIDEEGSVRVFEEVKNAITSFNGTITSEENMGRRPLAYTVAGNKTGTYVACQFNLATSQLSALNEKLRINKNILRFLIATKEQRTAEEMMDLKARQAKITERKKAEIAAPVKKEPHKRSGIRSMQKKAMTQAPLEEATAANAEKKPIENLDTEIEKLLNDDIKI